MKKLFVYEISTGLLFWSEVYGGWVALYRATVYMPGDMPRFPAEIAKGAWKQINEIVGYQ